MDKPKRLRRKDPIRKRPIRNASTYFRDSNSWNGQASDSAQTQSEGESPLDSVDEVVTNGVKLGYEVIEKYLLQGQKVAEEIRSGSPEKNSKEGNVQWLLTSMMRLNRDIAGFWIDAMETLVENPNSLLGLFGAAGSNGNGAASSSNGHGEPGPTANDTSTSVAIEIESRRRTQVTLDLRPSLILGVPHVSGLYASPDLEIPPLTDVSFQLDPESEKPVVKMKIPDNQPAALYTGVVLDRKTNDVRGTLCVRVLA